MICKKAFLRRLTHGPLVEPRRVILLFNVHSLSASLQIDGVDFGGHRADNFLRIIICTGVEYCFDSLL